MMMIAGAVGLIIIPYLGYLVGARKLLSGEHTRLTSSISTTQSNLRKVDGERGERDRVAERLEGFVNRSLGPDEEHVNHQLRTRLDRLGRELGLGDLRVGTGAVSSRMSPARGREQWRHKARRSYRDEVDFVEHEASISASGSLEQALRLVHRVQSSEWINRIDQVRVRPRRDGDKFEVTVRMTTLFLPGHEPAERALAAGDPGGFEPFMAIVGADPFHLPKAKPAPPPDTAVATKPPSPRRFPYQQWFLTGAVSQGQAEEIWVRNVKSGESRRLVPDTRLHEAVLLAVRGDQAEFRLGDERFIVVVGKSMDDRSPISR